MKYLFRLWDLARKDIWVPVPFSDMVYFDLPKTPEFINYTYNETGVWERRFVIMQFSGLKDYTGEFVYERDILRLSDGSCRSVHLTDGSFMVGDLLLFEAGSYKVVGHEYDNNWYVLKVDNKYDDGHFGMDGNIHSEEQIYSWGDIPYEEGYGERILVGSGEKPSPYEVDRLLRG